MLTDKVKSLHGAYSIRRAIKRVTKQHSNIVEEVNYSGLNPRVIIVGESHTEDSHLEFTIELMSVIRPEIVHIEGLKPEFDVSNYDYSLEDVLRRVGLEEMVNPLKDQLVKYSDSPGLADPEKPSVQVSAKHQSLLQRSNKQSHSNAGIGREDSKSKDFLSNFIYNLSISEFSQIRKVFLQMMSQHYDVLVPQLKQDIESCGSESLFSDLDRDMLIAALDFCNTSDPNYLLDFIEYAKLRSLSEVGGTSIRSLLLGSVDFLAYLDFFSDSILKSPYSFERPAGHQRLFSYANRLGVVMKPFDDTDAKSQLSVSLNNGTLSSNVSDELNQARETEMFRLVAESLSYTTTPILVNCGRYHAESNSQVISGLSESNIDYCQILLKGSDTVKSAVAAALYGVQFLDHK